MRLRALVTSSALALLSSCGGDRTGRAVGVTALTGDFARGELVYASTCATCHGPTGLGTEAGKALAEDFGHHDTLELATVVLNGLGQMPAQQRLTDQEIADVIAFGQEAFR